MGRQRCHGKVALAKMSLNSNDVNRTDVWKDLSTTEMESLQSWIDYFDQKYYIQGYLKDYHQKEDEGE